MTPTFLATAINQVRDAWKVSLAHGLYSGHRVDLYFPQESQARQFSVWQGYQPAEIMDSIGSPSPYMVRDIVKAAIRTKNQFTDLDQTDEVWQAKLDSQYEDRAVTWTYPTESQAREKFGHRASFTILDMFGTLYSVPQVVSEAYVFIAEEAARKAHDVEEAQHKANLAREQAALSQQSKEFGDISVATKKAQKLETSYLTTLWQAEAVRKRTEGKWWAGTTPTQQEFAQHQANLAQAQQLEAQAQSFQAQAIQAQAQVATEQAQYGVAVAEVKNARAAVMQRTIPQGINTYVITYGGAAGRYNGVYYASGKFKPSPTPLEWTGIYKPA